MTPNPYEPRNQLQPASKARSPRWIVWVTAVWGVIFATIVVAFFIAVIATYNDGEALAALAFRFIVMLLITGVAFNVATFSVLLWHGWSNRPNLPSFSKDEMLFDEKSSGGYSLLSWHTRRFPAKSELHISIARDQLWIRPRMCAFVSVGLQLDQVHQVLVDAARLRS